MADSFAAFTVVACLVAACEFGKGPASSALASAIATGGRRVRLRAQTRSLHNLAFTLGAALAGVSLAIGTLPAYYALPIGDAVMVLAEVVAIRRLPEIRSAARARLAGEPSPRCATCRSSSSRPAQRGARPLTSR